VNVSEALGELLERWGAGRASTPAEKRISARLAAQLAETADGPDSPFFPHIAKQIAQQVAGPDLSDELGMVAAGTERAIHSRSPLRSSSKRTSTTLTSWRTCDPSARA
jgi:hypothetical protein